MEGGTEDQRAYLDIGNQPASCWPSRVIISGDVHGRRRLLTLLHFLPSIASNRLKSFFSFHLIA